MVLKTCSVTNLHSEQTYKHDLLLTLDAPSVPLNLSELIQTMRYIEASRP